MQWIFSDNVNWEYKELINVKKYSEGNLTMWLSDNTTIVCPQHRINDLHCHDFWSVKSIIHETSPVDKASNPSKARQ